jgi:hypothetical protein
MVAPAGCSVISWTSEWPALCLTFPQDGARSSLRRGAGAIQEVRPPFSGSTTAQTLWLGVPSNRDWHSVCLGSGTIHELAGVGELSLQLWAGLRASPSVLPVVGKRGRCQSSTADRGRRFQPRSARWW